MTNFQTMQLLAMDSNVDRDFAVICQAEADELARQLHFKDLLNQRAARALPRRFTGEPITGFAPLDPCFRRFEEEPQPSPAERASDEYQDFRATQEKEHRHFGVDK